MPPRITVLGTGYLGATHAVCLAELGFEVLGLDTNEDQVNALAAGRLPFHEPDLEELLASNLRSGRLRFSTSYPEVAAFGDVHFVCVGTPQQADSAAADLSYLLACIDALAPLLTRPCLVVGKSTVPVGTSEIISERLARLSPAGSAAELAWNPEFLREGHAVADTMRPDRIVAGVRSARAEAILREVYAGPVAAGVPFLVTGLPTAELVKAAANAFLATKVSFINAMAEVCEAVGRPVTRNGTPAARGPAYTSRKMASARSERTPTTIRSGRIVSATACPSRRNSGFHASSTAGPAGESRARRSETISLVPTGTVDLPTTRQGRVSSGASASTDASRWDRSAAGESARCGVPTHTKCTSPKAAASA